MDQSSLEFIKSRGRVILLGQCSGTEGVITERVFSFGSSLECPNSPKSAEHPENGPFSKRPPFSNPEISLQSCVTIASNCRLGWRLSEGKGGSFILGSAEEAWEVLSRKVTASTLGGKKCLKSSTATRPSSKGENPLRASQSPLFSFCFLLPFYSSSSL